MSSKHTGGELEGSKPRDHEHSRQHPRKPLHQNWLMWVAVLIMLALIMVYIFTDSLSLRPGKAARPATPAINGP